MIRIRPACSTDVDQLATMLAALWPQSTSAQHAQELHLLLGGRMHEVLTTPLTILVAETTDDRLVGFVEVDLRSHADGCDPAQPVGYIEGWYVADDYRKQGVGSALIGAAEDWARSHGCVEMGSDAVIDNEPSQRAHEALSYEVVDRCVHYRKKL
jgi:aminoglycoside 6'-N-acetyltransferase I